MITSINVLPGLDHIVDRRVGETLRSAVEKAIDTLSRLIEAAVRRSNYKAYSNLIWQSLNRKKIDETEHTKLIINRLKREARIFQLINYLNHLISIYPKLQTMNYTEA